MTRPGANPFQPKPPPMDEQKRKLWQRLNLYIADNDGWTVSQPDTNPIRFECRADSSLPDLLRSAGYDVVSAGTSERLLPTIHETIRQDGGVTRITVQHVAPQAVSIYQFRLPVG